MRVAARRMQGRMRRASPPSRGNSPELRERVETLERIVTDDRHRLEREFERLDGGR